MRTKHQNFLKISLIFIIILGFNYGVSFQQFLHYDWNNPRGLSDSTSYLAMSNGDYTVSSGHRYRVIIPFLANIVRNMVQPLIPSEQLHWFGGVDAFSFYIINYFFSSLTGLFLYLFLIRLKFEPQLSLLGVLIFLGSRITILATGAPIVDSLYFLSIIIIVYFCLTQNTTALAILTPILILSKETIIPFLFLPFLVNQINRKLFGVSLMVSFVVFFWVRDTISSWSPNHMENNDPIFDVVVKNNYLGGIIAPGVNLSLNTLISKASLIPSLTLTSVNKVLGKNTKSAVKSGFYWGYAGLIDNVIKKIINQTNNKYKIIFTGGLSHLFKKTIDAKVKIDRDLTIKGLLKVIHLLKQK